MMMIARSPMSVGKGVWGPLRTLPCSRANAFLMFFFLYVSSAELGARTSVTSASSPVSSGSESNVAPGVQSKNRAWPILTLLNSLRGDRT